MSWGSRGDSEVGGIQGWVSQRAGPAVGSGVGPGWVKGQVQGWVGQEAGTWVPGTRVQRTAGESLGGGPGEAGFRGRPSVFFMGVLYPGEGEKGPHPTSAKCSCQQMNALLVALLVVAQRISRRMRGTCVVLTLALTKQRNKYLRRHVTFPTFQETHVGRTSVT